MQILPSIASLSFADILQETRNKYYMGSILWVNYVLHFNYESAWVF